MRITIVENGVVPASKYGGAERVVWYLGRELARMGHDVTFMTGRGSSSDFARVIEIDPSRDLREQLPSDTDIFHFNFNPHWKEERPHVATIHGNVRDQGITQNAVFLTRNHAGRYGSDSFVYNGLDWDDYGPVNLGRPRRFHHFLGKAAWRVKNVQGAIDIVNSIKGARLRVLGGHRLNIKMGFRLTLSPKIRFEGMVDDIRKKELIEQSSGLIFPVTWHEPFGLAITESLYFGAPVFGTPYGSLPELVAPEVGALSDSESELAAFVRSGDYSPRVCHEYARDLFNSRIMAEGYLRKYEQVLDGHVLNSSSPELQGQFRDLPWHK